jgi:hypothetical protein
MHRLAATIFFICLYGVLQAQSFAYNLPPKTKDKFHKAFAKLINDVPNSFVNIKGKAFTFKDAGDQIKSAKVFHNKVKLPGLTSAKIVFEKDSTAEYVAGAYTEKSEAQDQAQILCDKIADALSNKVIMFYNDSTNIPDLLEETSIGYTLMNGFFHYNMFVQVQWLPAAAKYRVALKIAGGTPRFYYHVQRNEPITSFMFVSAFKDQFGVFNAKRERSSGCLGQIPPFNCKGMVKQGDTAQLLYTKTGFEYLPDARKEFEACLSNVRVSLGEDYVYYLEPACGNKLRRVIFLKNADIDRLKRKCIQLVLVQNEEQNYHLELGFIYN